MTSKLHVEDIIASASQKERTYDWLEASDSYIRALSNLAPSDAMKGRIHELCGYSLHKAAFQADSSREFEDRMHSATVQYEEAAKHYSTGSGAAQRARFFRCKAMIAYLGCLFANDPVEGKRLAEDAWAATKDAMTDFEKAGESLEFGITYNQQGTIAGLAYAYATKGEIRSNILMQAIELGDNAARMLSSLSEPEQLTKAYTKTAIFTEIFSLFFLDLDQREVPSHKAQRYWRRAVELSQETAMAELSDPLSHPLTDALGWGHGTDTALKNFELILDLQKRTKDRFAIGSTLDWLGIHTGWKAAASDDPEEQLKLLQKSLELAEYASEQYSLISPADKLVGEWLTASYWFACVHYFSQLAEHEVDLAKRRELLEKARAEIPKLLEIAKGSGYLDAVRSANDTYSEILTLQARIEDDPQEKRMLLEKAIDLGRETLPISEDIEPFFHWARALNQNRLADAKSELSGLITEPQAKIALLEDAAKDKESCIKLLSKFYAFQLRKIPSADPALTGLANVQYEYGDMLLRLRALIGSGENLQKAIQSFKEAAQTFQRLNLTSRVAECYWKVAQSDDTAGNHQKAAESFEDASGYFERAAESIPSLAAIYQQNALYLQAWAEIEKAIYSHEIQEYGSARDSYSKAGKLLESTKHWTYLAPNFSAWAKLDNAEFLSRKESGEEATKEFESAAELFKVTRTSLHSELNRLESPEELEMAKRLVKAADLRIEYCDARILLEGAKLLDRRGSHMAASEKFGQAGEAFEKLERLLDSEQDKRESRLIKILSRAWQALTEAEAKASPELCKKAAQLFDEAKESSPNESTTMLILGHSHFCQALEAATRFTDTRKMGLHDLATQHLESASNYYLKGGFDQASEYAKATELLLDSYGQMDNAKRERNPSKKAKLFMMAEKILQESADAYQNADYFGKREEVLKLLEKVQKERELAVSLTELLHSPALLSSTKAFITPTPTYEKAVGLERLEHADVRARLIARKKDLKVGEEFNLEIEMVNAGRGPAQLVKVEELVPKEFDVSEQPELYRIESNFLNMKGRQLDPLKTEEVKIILKPKNQGRFILKPRILFLDEGGKYRSHEPEPIEVTVKELGISGWLKGA